MFQMFFWPICLVCPGSTVSRVLLDIIDVIKDEAFFHLAI